MKMWRKLKKVDWNNGQIDLLVAMLFFAGLGFLLLENDTAQAKIREFNTLTQNWTEVRP